MKMTAFATVALLLAGAASQSTPPQPPAPTGSLPPTTATTGEEKWPGVDPRPPNAPTQKPAVPGQTRAPERKTDVAFDVVTVAEGLNKPWGLAFLPNGTMLVTEKPTGALRIVAVNGTLSPPVTGVPKVDGRGQGGLLDVSVGPRFAQDRTIYWCYSDPAENGANHTAVARGKLVEGAEPRLDEVQTIYRQVPSLNSTMHYGCRLVWRRDGTLLVTQGDRSVPAGRIQAQQMDSGIGKIVRINADGSIPKDNPFVGKEGVRPEIWSYGHRNIQAAALHPGTGELWTVEHGARGGDELNRPLAGRNYGWPVITYGVDYSGVKIGEGTAKEGMEQPVYYWDPSIAPSGGTFYTGDLFPAWKGNLLVGALAGQHLARLVLDGEKVVGEEKLLTDLGARIRDVRVGPDGAVWLLVDQSNGRILRLVPG
jgi:glucose/arabinose dehydrogenase